MSDIASRVKKIIVDKLGVDEAEVTNEASFTNDLGADSLDTVELIMEFEKEFNISIPDEQAETITTVGQAIAYLDEHAKYSRNYSAINRNACRCRQACLPVGRNKLLRLLLLITAKAVLLILHSFAENVKLYL